MRKFIVHVHNFRLSFGFLRADHLDAFSQASCHHHDCCCFRAVRLPYSEQESREDLVCTLSCRIVLIFYFHSFRQAHAAPRARLHTLFSFGKNKFIFQHHIITAVACKQAGSTILFHAISLFAQHEREAEEKAKTMHLAEKRILRKYAVACMTLHKLNLI